MIDVIQDDLIEVRQLANEKFGNRVHPNTCYRWASKGAGGIKLEAIKVGRKWFTTRKAFQLFCEAQTQKAIQKESKSTENPASTISRNCPCYWFSIGNLMANLIRMAVTVVSSLSD